MQCPVVDLAPSGSHLCGGFLQPVPPFVGNEEGDCSGQKCSGSAEKLVSHVESHHSGFKRGGSIEDAELSSPKKRKLSVSDAGGNSSDLCTESNGCLVYVYRATDGKDSSDRESVYSVQSKVTEIVKDSSDDLWFLEEDAAAASSDHHSVDVYADEYEVVSEAYSETDSDMDNILSSQEDVIVICEESDLEFFADCEWSNIDDDSSDDDDLLQGDKWFCLTCQNMNGPLHRFCESCWTLRPNWLPKSSPRVQQLQHSESLENKDSIALHAPERDKCLDARAEDNSQLKVHSSLNACDSPCEGRIDAELNHSEVTAEGCSVVLDGTAANSIVLQETQSSQDSGFGSVPRNVLSSSQTLSATPSSSDVSLASLDKSLRDRFSVSSSTPDGEILPAPPRITTSCHVPSGSCIICLSQPKEATIIHGTTGHQSCCYRCACRLRRHRKPCPVCRQPIQKVVRNYFVDVP